MDPSLPSVPPGKPSPWLITALVVILGCCLCVGCLGLLVAFGPDLLHELGF
jgi:hypothetical protein